MLTKFQIKMNKLKFKKILHITECGAKYKDIICTGRRHSDCHNKLRNMGIAIFPGITNGFITSGGKFVSRTKAAEIALSCGQIDAIPIEGIITSYDIWQKDYNV